MQLRFKLLTGRDIYREVNEGITALEAKEMLGEEMSLPVERIRLVFKAENRPGREVRDHESLFNENVGAVNESTFHVVLRLRGD